MWIGKTTSLLLLLAEYAAATATIPTMLPITPPSETLIVTFGNDTVLTTPGETLQSAQTKSAPTIRLPSADPAKTYLLLFVDPSINATSPAHTGLHEIVANLRATSGSNGTLTMIPSNNTAMVAEALAPYVYPQVPAGGSSHQYTLLLFEQPAVLDVPVTFDSFLPFPTNLLTRVNFPLLDFISEVGLGQPVAANWFWEGPANATTSATPTSSTPSASVTGKSAQVSGTSVTSSPAASTGAAATGRYSVSGLSVLLVPAMGVAGALVF